MDPIPPIQPSPVPPPMPVRPGHPGGQPAPMQVVAAQSTRWGMLAAVALFAGVIGAGAYFMLNQGPDYADFVPTYTPRPSASADPTADWKTYTEPVFGLATRYPKEWTLVTHDKPIFGLSLGDYLMVISIGNDNLQKTSLLQWAQTSNFSDPRYVDKKFESLGKIGAFEAVRHVGTLDEFFMGNMGDARVIMVQSGDTPQSELLPILSTFRFTR